MHAEDYRIDELPQAAQPLIFDADSSQAVLAAALPGLQHGERVDAARLSNADTGAGAAAADQRPSTVKPCVAAIYQLDSLVRRATSLQLTRDARASAQPGVPA